MTKLTDAATLFVEGFEWCERVIECVPHLEIGDVLGVCKVDLVPASANADSTVWSIVGDIPPAYIAFEPGDSWRDALRGYTYEMDRWVWAVRAGQPVDELI